jgi:hypothetical protein
VLDLHTHSTASDGSLRPAELVRLAGQVGLTALALTDHDTVDGLEEAAEEARGGKVRFVPGMELSARLPGGTLHLVGLFVDAENAELLAGLERVRAMRAERNPRIAEALEACGAPVSLEEAAAAAGGEVVSRVHFAEVMVHKGLARNVEEAFARTLGNGGPADVPKERLEAGECLRLIRVAGGVPILAHPEQTRRRGAELEALVDALAQEGLLGVEVVCSGCDASATAALTRLAATRGLLCSGGSDFHGRAKPRILLGRGFGRMRVPDAFLEPLERAAEKVRNERCPSKPEGGPR